MNNGQSSSLTSTRSTKIKEPFRPSTAFRRIEAAIASYPKAMLFELADLGYNSPFHQLMACLISIRTLDEVSRESSLRLLKAAPTVQRLEALSESTISALIRPATFYKQKAKTLKALASEISARFGGETPCEQSALLSLKGVGPKCANLVLGVACGRPFIGVDIHVHRVTNRWGYIQASNPEASMKALEQKLPRRYWVDINRLLVPFGKHICTGARPKCSTCPVLDMCQQVGVVHPR
ncbi:MAG: endonuclease III [Bdellovibrionales bacterium]